LNLATWRLGSTPALVAKRKGVSLAFDCTQLPELAEKNSPIPLRAELWCSGVLLKFRFYDNDMLAW